METENMFSTFCNTYLALSPKERTKFIIGATIFAFAVIAITQG